MLRLVSWWAACEVNLQWERMTECKRPVGTSSIRPDLQVGISLAAEIRRFPECLDHSLQIVVLIV